MNSLNLAFKNKKEPKVGCVLISDPFLDEDYFRRSVVLICTHDDNEGSFGLVLNNFVKIELTEIDASFDKIKSRVSIGGPIDTEYLFFIHTYGDKVRDTVKIMDNLYFGGNFEDLKEQILNDEEANQHFRFFLGYSGWSKNQLKTELSENSWIVANNITTKCVFQCETDDFWKLCLSKQGKNFELISRFPLHPNEN